MPSAACRYPGAMLAIALVGVLLCPFQAPKPAEQGEVKSSQQSSSKTLETWTDKEAKAKVKAFQKAVKPKKASMAVRKRALDGLVGGQNALLIKPLRKFIEKDSSVVLRKQAIGMLADQPASRVHSQVLTLLKNARVTGNPQVHGALIRALSNAGYESSDWKAIADVFESDYDTERVPVHEAVLELVTKHKEQQAIPLLLRNIDEPNPENVDSASNPPKEYWKARWHSWAAWKAKVKDALFAITGQRFSTGKEAKAWLRKNPLKKSKKKRKKR